MLALVLRQEMGACLIGIVAGVVGALLLASLLESLLFGVTPRGARHARDRRRRSLLVVTAIACLHPGTGGRRVSDPRDGAAASSCSI